MKIEARNYLRIVASIVLAASGLSTFANTHSAVPDWDRLRGPLYHDAIPKWQRAADQAHQDRLKPPSALWRAIWQSLDRHVNAEPGGAPLNTATNPRNASELYALSTWLRWRILSKNADGRYSYAYAFNLGRMKSPTGSFSNEAALFLFHARLALAIDGSRCADWSSPQSVILAYESQPHLRPLRELVATMSKKQRASVMFEAIAIEEMRGERPPQNWLCQHRSKLQQANSNAGEITELQSSTEEDAAAAVPNGQTGDEDRAEAAALIDDATWKKFRRDLLDLNLKRVLDAFDEE